MQGKTCLQNLVGVSLLVALVAACSPHKAPGIARAAPKTETSEAQSGFSPAQPRMHADVYHPGIHLFTEGYNRAEVVARARKFKQLVLGDSDAPTCYKGPDGMAQLAVQTEFTVLDFVNSGESTDSLDERIDALLSEDLAVHLLLPIHDVRGLGNWRGVNWQAESNWSNSSTFMPMKPCPEDWENGSKCPYDVLFENFHRPVIEHLVATDRAQELAVIYVANEFGYDSALVRDSAADWGRTGRWKLARAEALAYTAARALNTARNAAAGAVPVGLKLIDVNNPNTGWATDPNHGTDQLAYILNDVMGPSGDVLGYDAYFGDDDDDFDVDNRKRLSPFLGEFSDGRFELAELGRVCRGLPGQFPQGRRTQPTDITGAAAAWSDARGLNLFAFNTDARDARAGCYALTDPNDFELVFPGADDEASGLWAQIQVFTGSDAPAPCPDA